MVTNETSDSLNRYFSTLSHTGYKSYNEVYSLLVMTFIEEMLCGPMSEFITEDDYKLISDSMNCLYGSCMIPFPSYKEGTNDNIFGLHYSCWIKNRLHIV